MNKYLCAFAFLGVASGSAQAFDAVPSDPQSHSVIDWSGAYLGAQVGHSWGISHQQYEPNKRDYSDPNPKGLMGGLYLGYDYQLDNSLVLGLDADISWTGAEGNSLFYFSDGTPYTDEFNSNLSVKWTGAVRARVGYAMGQFLSYVAAGPSIASANYTYTFRGGVVENFEAIYKGWTAGVGVDYSFTENLVGRLEYRHSDYGNVLNTDSENRVSLKSNSVQLGLSYKF
ncbi:porin family protein [Devosia sp. WQ 349]|uniref:outer membrane protein n=1 Tax=Devosia sp. WQ 349K1 TaxID=2800329 RepID=UPI0019088FC6|nr:outer membrane protein [Devosia sp. WQ 349K1]MBK1792930.1 porin family protein [Devosia sp. WQ 349K1]